MSAKDLLARACPHADWPVAERLWRSGLYRKLANYLWVEFLMARGSERLWGGAPYWLTVDPINFCQLQCPFCPTGANRGVRDKASMTLEHFRRLLSEVGPSVIHLDIMNWGESLLNKRLPEMIACAKEHGIDVKLDANFNDASPEAIEGLVRSGLDVLSLSIDGISQETYGRYRAGGKLEKVLANLDALLRTKKALGSRTPRVIWQFLVFRHNEHEADRVEAFARERGVDQVSLVSPYLPNEAGYLWEWQARDPRFALYPAPAAEPPAAELERARTSAHVKRTPAQVAYRTRRFSPSQLLRPRAAAALWRQARRERGLAAVAERLAAAWAEWRRVRAGSGAVPFKEAGERRICKWPWAGIAVNPDGSASPCCSVEDQGDDFGNVFRDGWSSLWNGARYRESRRHVRRYVSGREGVQPESEHVCRRCTAIGHANFNLPLHWSRPDAEPAREGVPA